MNRTSSKYYENDYIMDVAKRIADKGDEGGLVYNKRDELIGCFTYKELLEGIVKNYESLHNICKEYDQITENSHVKNIDFRECNILPVINKNGEITGFLTRNAHLNAIAKLSQIENNRLDAIFNSAHNGILSINFEGQITAMNPPAEKMALITKEEAIGKFLTDVVTPSGLLEVIRTGEGHTEKYKVGNRMYLTHRSPIFDGKRLVGAVGVFQDISEVDIVSSELDSVKQLVSEMDTIIDYSSDGICIADPKGNIIKSNHRFHKLYFGSLSEELKTNEFQRLIEDVVEKGQHHNIMETNLENNNSIIVSAIPVKNDNQHVERIVISVKDMTVIDNLRQELEKTQLMLKNVQEEQSEKNFIAIADSMKNLVAQVKQVAKVDVTLLLTGEKGVGKEALANVIKESSLGKISRLLK